MELQRGKFDKKYISRVHTKGVTPPEDKRVVGVDKASKQVRDKVRYNVVKHTQAQTLVYCELRAPSYQREKVLFEYYYSHFSFEKGPGLLMVKNS